MTTSDKYLSLYFNHYIDRSKSFILDTAKYVCLEIAVKIDLADRGAEDYYKKERQSFYNRYYGSDIEFNFEEHDQIDGKRDYYFVKTSGEPKVVKWLFFIFTLLIPICEIYKVVLKCRSKDQYYCMYKIVSNDTVLIANNEEDNALNVKQ